MYRCRRRAEQHRGYDDLLDTPAEAEARIDPRVFISIGSMALWSGGKPRLFRRLLKRGDLRLDFRSLGALVWTAWASVQPRSLRAFIRALLLARRVRARYVVKTTGPVTWAAPIAAQRSVKTSRISERAKRSDRSAAMQAAATARSARGARVMAE
jgi:hypothetical protein